MSYVLSDDQVRRATQKLEFFGVPLDDYLTIDETEFRARARERSHHTLEIQLYSSLYRDRPLSPGQADPAKLLLNLWEQRGIPTDEPDYRYIATLISLADKDVAGEKVDLSQFAPRPVSEEEGDLFVTILKQRRSVREFTDEEVPDALIDRVLDAGLWAAHSCNLQSVRYLVIRERTSPGLFKGSDVPGGPVHLVVLQDERVYRANPYNPVRNRLLDAGAAAQNICLAAHALGLEGVWLTFNDAIKQRLIERFELPAEIQPVTYVDVGYGDQTPAAPQRIGVDEVTLARA